MIIVDILAQKPYFFESFFNKTFNFFYYFPMVPAVQGAPVRPAAIDRRDPAGCGNTCEFRTCTALLAGGKADTNGRAEGEAR